MKNTSKTLKKRNELRKYWRETIDYSLVPKTIEKKCIDCGKIKDCPWTSSFSQKGNPEYRACCISCLRIREKIYVKKNREKISLSSKGRRKILKEKYIKYLGGSCFKCGYSKSMRALTFHHKVREEKEFTLSSCLDWSWNKIKAELDKCALLCFNCHMEIEDEYELNKYK